MKNFKFSLQKSLPYILIITGIIGILCSFFITYDRMQMLENPQFVPNCNLNPVISCGNVLSSKEGSVFGFPNSFIGLAVFAVITTIGAAMLAGAKFKRWFWLSLNAGMIFGVAFCMWLFYHSVYVINSLCPYCMSVWAITITAFWYVTLYNVDNKHLSIPKGKSQGAYIWVRTHHFDLLILWLLIIGGLILKHFWYYYGKNF
jgi:uncharacterized membrane protein